MNKKNRPTNSSSVRGGYRENAGRKSSWNHRDTCTIRIPKPFAEQLVELARRLDNGELLDTETESNLRNDDLVTESIKLGADRLDSLTHLADNPAKIDTETESNLPDDDSVTQSILASTLDTESLTDPLDKLVNIDIDTKSNLGDYDTVTKSISSSSHSLLQLACKPELEENFDNDTKSKTPGEDNVTESTLGAEHQTLTQSIPDLNEALSLAVTIIKAKKSARESIARLLSKLYSAQLSPDDLSSTQHQRH